MNNSNRLSLYNFLLITNSLLLLNGCFANKNITVDFKNKTSKTSKKIIQVVRVQLINNQFVVTGDGLDSTTTISMDDNGTSIPLQIESKSQTSLIANTLSNVTFAADKILNFVISNSEASSTFVVDFSLCNSTLAGKGFNCNVAPNNKDVLSYDHNTGKWKPRSINGLTYQGAWDASTPFPSASLRGDYYIVSAPASSYNVGDWIVFNGNTFDQIDNSQAIVSVFGNTGIITAKKGDYTFTKLADVDLLTDPPIAGEFLKFDGTNWVPASIVSSGGTVTAVTGVGPISVATGTTTPAITISQSNSTTNGYVTSTDWNTFNNKQSAIPLSDSLHYYRGDKTWQTLNTSVVPESSNLYFSNARVLSTQLTGLNSSLTGSVTSSDSLLVALGKTQYQLGTLTSGGTNYLLKNGTETVTGQITIHASTGALKIPFTPDGSDLTDAANVQYVNTYADAKVAKNGDTMTGDLQVNTALKLKDNASNTISLKAPASVTSSYVLTFPATAGTNNQVLTTNGAGILSWSSPSGSAPVSSVNTQTGDVVLTTSNIAEGSNQYFSGARVLASQITAPTLTNSAIATSDSIITALGKLQAQINNTLSTALTGLSTTTDAAISSADSIVVGLGKLQAQLGSKADKTNVSQIITAASVTGLSDPVGDTDAVNKGYFDTFAKWALSGGNATRASGKVGIGTSTPEAVLDVAGEIKIGNTSATCTSTNAGAQRYNSGLVRMEFCNGSSWQEIGNGTPSGAIMAFAQATCPSGWLAANGSAVSRSTYSSLYASISTMYGVGDGSTTFNLPDYRGYFLRGWNNGSNKDPDAATRTDRGDGVTGDNVGSKQSDDVRMHTHLLNATSGSSGVNSPNGNFLGKGNGTMGNNYTANTPDGTLHVNSISWFGGTESRPKNINVLYCVKF